MFSRSRSARMQGEKASNPFLRKWVLPLGKWRHTGSPPYNLWIPASPPTICIPKMKWVWHLLYKSAWWKAKLKESESCRQTCSSERPAFSGLFLSLKKCTATLYFRWAVRKLYFSVHHIIKGRNEIQCVPRYLNPFGSLLPKDHPCKRRSAGISPAAACSRALA